MRMENRKKNSLVRFLKPILVFSLISLLILLPQIYHKYIVLGNDVVFHFNRFYDLAMQMESGKFNYFQSVFGFNGSGRIVNALYGYDLAFFLSFLLFLSKSWLKFQLLSGFLCLFASGFNMYLLSRKANISSNLAIISGMMYMSTASVTYYVHQQAFHGWGSAFLPLLFIPALNSISDKERPINSVFLAIPVSILINSHVLTALIGVIAIVPFYIVSFINSKKKFTWMRDALFAVVITLILTMNTLLSYFEVFLSNNILSPFIPESMDLEAMKLSTSDIAYQKDAGLIFSALLLFQICLTVLNWKKLDSTKKLINSTGIVFLLLSSTVFPWDLLANKFSFISIFQFPSRFSVVAFLLLILGFTINVNELNKKEMYKKRSILLSGITMLSLLLVISVHNIMQDKVIKWQENPISMGNNKPGLQIEEKEVLKNNLRSSDLSLALKSITKGTPDYLPIPKEKTSKEMYDIDKPYSIYNKEILNNELNKQKQVLKDGSIEIKWVSEDTEKIILPVVIYSHSIVEINGEIIPHKDLEKSLIGSLKLHPVVGTNTVNVSYQPKFNLKLVLIVKIVGWVFVIGYCILNKIKFSKK